jgi:hypothetical protein
MRFFEQEKQRAIDIAVEVRNREEAAKLEAQRAKAGRAEAKRLDAEAQVTELLPTEQENQSGPIELGSLKPEEIKALLSRVMERSTATSFDPWGNNQSKPTAQNSQPLRSYNQNSPKTWAGYLRASS